MKEEKANDERGMMNDEQNANSDSSLITHHSSFQNPATPTCARIAPELKAYQDGQLGWGTRLRVRRHVANCAHCREEMQAMRDFSQFLQGGEGDTLSPQLRARILAAVPDTVPAASSVSRIRSLSRPMLAWGAAASALLICIVLSPLLLKKDQDTMQMSIHSAPMAANKTAADTSAARSVTEGAPSASKFDSAYGEMKTAAPSVSVASPAAPQMERFAAKGAPMLASKPSPLIAAPADKSVAESAAASVSKGAAEPQSRVSVKKRADFDRSASLAQGNSAPKKPVGRMLSSTAVRARNAPSSHKTVAATPATITRGKNKDENILLVVADIEQTRVTLEQAVKENGGSVEAFKNTPAENSDSEATVTLDVPAAQLPALLSQLDAFGERKPFVPAPIARRTSAAPAPGAVVNGVNPAANKTANFRVSSGRPPQSQAAARSQPRAQTKPDIETMPSAPASAKPKAPVQLEPPEPNVHVTIHLRKSREGMR